MVGLNIMLHISADFRLHPDNSELFFELAQCATACMYRVDKSALLLEKKQ